MNEKVRFIIKYSFLYVFYSIITAILYYNDSDQFVIIPFFILLGISIPPMITIDQKFWLLPFIHNIIHGVILIQELRFLPLIIFGSLLVTIFYVIIAKIIQNWIEFTDIKENFEFNPIQIFQLFLYLGAILFIYAFIYESIASYIFASQFTFQDLFLFTLSNLFGLVGLGFPIILYTNKLNFANQVLGPYYINLEDYTPSKLIYVLISISSVIFFIVIMSVPNLFLYLPYSLFLLMIGSLFYAGIFASTSTAIFTTALSIIYSIIQPDMDNEMLIFLHITIILGFSINYLIGIKTSNSNIQTAKRIESELQLLFLHKNQLISRFAGGLAHEVNNANQIVMSYTELLRLILENLDNKEGLEFTDKILEQIQSINNLMDDMLTISKKQPVKLENQNFEQSLLKLYELFNRISGSNIEIKLDLEEVPDYFLDLNQFRQIIINLVKNSIDAIPKGQKGIITLKLYRRQLNNEFKLFFTSLNPGEYIVVEISDNGLGIPKSEIEKIFEPYYTTKGKLGVGLGLSVVRSLVQLNGGQLNIQSTPGVGTKIQLYFNIEQDPDKKIMKPQIIAHKSQLTLPNSIRNIIILDDEQNISTVLEQQLVSNNVKITSYNDSLKFSKFFITKKLLHKYDLLITDMSMPDKSGLEIIEQIREIDSNFPILVISGYPLELDRLADTNGVHYLRKPFGINELIRKINKLESNK